MTTSRLAFVLLFALPLAAALPAADPVADTVEALRKAKTKADRLAILKGKDDEYIGQCIAKLLDAQRLPRVSGEFAEVALLQQWAEEATALLADPGKRERYEVACL